MASEHHYGINIVLDGTNYSGWSHLMLNLLKGKQLWKYVAMQRIQNMKNGNQKKEKLILGLPILLSHPLQPVSQI